MKFEWKNGYVPEGQMEPDKHGRWSLDCYIFIHIDKALPKYDFCKEMFNRKHMPVRIASIGQNEKLEGDQNYTKFHVVMPSFEGAGNWGMSTEYHYYSNNLEELKKQVEDNFIQIQKVFKFCR